MTKLEELDKRSREVFRHLVDAYVETGEPVGSKFLSGRLDTSLSPATIRNVMADLEAAGFLYALQEIFLALCRFYLRIDFAYCSCDFTLY